MAQEKKEAPRADRRIESLSKQAKRSAVDEQILRDVRKTRKELETAFDKATTIANIGRGMAEDEGPPAGSPS